MPKLMALFLSLGLSISVNAQSFQNAAAQQSQALQSGAMLNIMLGSLLMGSCMSAKKPNMMMCLLGGMALMQGMQQSQAAQATDNSALSTAAQTPAATTSNVQPAAPRTILSPSSVLPTQIKTQASVRSGLQAVKTAGYQISSTGLTLPNGQFVPASKLGSPGDFKQLGFSDAEINDANAQTKLLLNKMAQN